MIFTMRVIDLVAVVIGLAINIGEYRHAKWVHRELWQQRINGERQMIAGTFQSEELMKVWVQSLLLFSVLVGFVISSALPKAIFEDLWWGYRLLMFLSFSARIAVSILLATKAVKHRRARRAILSIAQPSEAQT